MNCHPVRRAGLELRRAISSMVELYAARCDRPDNMASTYINDNVAVVAFLRAHPAPAGVAGEPFFLDGAALTPAVASPE